MARNSSHQILPVTVSGAMIALTVFLGYFADRPAFSSVLGSYGLWFGLYGLVLFGRGWTTAQQRWWIGLGLGLRALLLCSTPNFSDDVFRFLWDGHLSAAGLHPFAHPPAYYLEQQLAVPGNTAELYQRLNSPQYHTVYPPVCQAVFWLAVRCFPGSMAGAIFVIKLFLLACEAGTIAVLSRFQVRPSGSETPAPGAAPLSIAVAYALNPLAIQEITGNCHFEGAMLCFLLAGLWALQRQRRAAAAVFWALATAAKLLPLLFLPIVLLGLGWRKALRFVLVFGGTAAVLFLPLLQPEILLHMVGSLQLYFRQFEFNASLYYVLKSMGEAYAPPKLDVARTLGPILAGLVFLSVLVVSVYKIRRDRPGEVPAGLGERLPNQMVLALGIYLSLATTVHPWYVVPLFGLSLLTPWRFPLVWSAAVVLSYSHYAGGGFQENYCLIGLEYALVVLAIGWDVCRRRRRLNLSSSRPQNTAPDF